MANMVNVLPANHQHVNIVNVSIVCLLMLAFSSKHCSAYVMPRRATGIAVDSQSCFLIFCLLIFPFHCPLHSPNLSQVWSSPGGRSHLRRWWQGLCSGTTGRQQTAALWRDTTWECTSQHTGWVHRAESREKEDPDSYFSDPLTLSKHWYLGEKKGHHQQSGAGRGRAVTQDR